MAGTHNLIKQTILFVISIAHSVRGYGSGAPCAAQHNLHPSDVFHGRSRSFNVTPAPFRFSVADYDDLDVKTYAPGRIYTIRLISLDGAHFRGFVIQPRLATRERSLIGNLRAGKFIYERQIFNDYGVQFQNCAPHNNDSITHRSGTLKFFMEAKWQAEKNYGPIQFTMTIVQEQNEFWESWQPASGYLVPEGLPAGDSYLDDDRPRKGNVSAASADSDDDRHIKEQLLSQKLENHKPENNAPYFLADQGTDDGESLAETPRNHSSKNRQKPKSEEPKSKEIGSSESEVEEKQEKPPPSTTTAHPPSQRPPESWSPPPEDGEVGPNAVVRFLKNQTKEEISPSPSSSGSKIVGSKPAEKAEGEEKISTSAPMKIEEEEKAQNKENEKSKLSASTEKVDISTPATSTVKPESSSHAFKIPLSSFNRLRELFAQNRLVQQQQRESLRKPIKISDLLSTVEPVAVEKVTTGPIIVETTEKSVDVPTTTTSKPTTTQPKIKTTTAAVNKIVFPVVPRFPEGRNGSEPVREIVEKIENPGDNGKPEKEEKEGSKTQKPSSKNKVAVEKGISPPPKGVSAESKEDGRGGASNSKLLTGEGVAEDAALSKSLEEQPKKSSNKTSRHRVLLGGSKNSTDDYVDDDNSADEGAYCSSNPCFNKATCRSIDEEERFECKCAPGWTGPVCDLHDYCEKKPCKNGGVCVNGDYDFACNCSTLWVGKTCDHKCPSSLCKNGGTCVLEDGGGYACACKPGFAGSQCETDINDCANNPCVNGATCVDKINTFSCQCPDGYMGEKCHRPCQNIYKSCQSWGEEGRCESTRRTTKWFDINCGVTCGQCVFSNDTVRTDSPLPPVLEPLSFLIGKWTINTTHLRRFPIDFLFGNHGYYEEIEFAPVNVPMFGTPSINYTARARNNQFPDDEVSNHGFLTLKPNASPIKVSLMSVGNEGITLIEEGIITKEQTVELRTDYIAVIPGIAHKTPSTVKRIFGIYDGFLRETIERNTTSGAPEFLTKYYYKEQHYQIY